MGKRVEVLDTSRAASTYAAVLLGLRLLRALLASIAFAIVLFASIGVIFAVATVGAVAGWLLLDQPLSAVALRFAVGAILAGAGVVVVAGMALVVIQTYRRVKRGSVLVAGTMLVLGVGFFVLACVDFVVHVARAFSVEENDRGKEIFASAQDLWPGYVAIGFIYGSVGLVRLVRGGDRWLIVDAPDVRSRRAELYQMMGIPIVPGQHRSRLKSALVLGWLAFACEGFAFGTYFTGGSADQLPSMSVTAAVVIVVIAWPLSVVMLYGLLTLSQWIWLSARRAGQPSLQESLYADRRPPVLFLRSFTDDQVSLTTARVPRYLRVMDPGIVRHRFEELLVFGLANTGPLIAIGNPSDPRTPVGASRQYFGPGEWRDQVLTHMSQARVIVVSLSTTEALGWELDQIRGRGHLHKCLFIVPPGLSEHADAIRTIASRAGLELESPTLASGQDVQADKTRNHILACWSSDPDTETVVCSAKLTELDYEIALRHFVATSRVCKGP